MGNVFRMLVSTCVGSVEDTQCGFKLLTREAAAATMPHLHVRRWAYDVEMLHLAQRHGMAVFSASVDANDVPKHVEIPFGKLREEFMASLKNLATKVVQQVTP